MRALEASGAMIPSGDSADRDVTERLRDAISSESYEDALRLLAEYKREIEQALPIVSNDPERATHLATAANDLLRWAKSTVLANRAHAQARLGKLDRAVQYQPAKRAKPRIRLAEG